MKENHTMIQERQSSAESCCDSTSAPCCGGSAGKERLAYPKIPPQDVPEWVCGLVETPVGDVPVITPEWSRADHWGQMKARTTSFRMRYTVPPGLYAIGRPTRLSNVFVSANYKLSFDILRRSLKDMDAWILVLDTKGINVWCAAGKGTFGTQELITRLTLTQLHNIVSHHWLILPQLGAPGVNAAVVEKRTTFKVMYGPVEAKDIPQYVANDCQATKAMRTIRFTILDRLVLTPIELNAALKYYPLYALIVLIVFGLQPAGILFRDAWNGGLPFLLLGLIAIFTGAFLTPLLLPVIPFRAFALKGGILGFLATIAFFGMTDMGPAPASFLRLAAYIIFTFATSYIALQFTGATTFTSLSGVQKELRFGLPVYIAGGVVSLICIILFKLMEWGIV